MTDLLDATGDLVAALDALDDAVAQIQVADRDGLSPAEELALLGRLEEMRRRLDHGTVLAAGHLDASAAFSLDGHKTAKGALKAIGRLSGSEAHGRLQTDRALRRPPLVEAAYAEGRIPTEHVRAMARTVSNPRVAEWVPGADPIFAHHATILGYDDFVAALRQWEALADADGADQASERCHERRSASLLESTIDGSFRLESNHGAMQGAAWCSTGQATSSTSAAGSACSLARVETPPSSRPCSGGRAGSDACGPAATGGAATCKWTIATRPGGAAPPTSPTPTPTAGFTTGSRSAGSARSGVRAASGQSIAPTAVDPSPHPSEQGRARPATGPGGPALERAASRHRSRKEVQWPNRSRAR